ncbi:hypothetical protein HAX54_033450 [Datura stramonium]|uniref:Uncharacterized protein n=1 Tax=Datura stramonium TaxID=4076 RepID=A0ABS8VFS3_DATST|nr:hypothetical protein [Datura stramonium]
MADKSKSTGVVEDVLLKVETFILSSNFMMLYYSMDIDIPIILGFDHKKGNGTKTHNIKGGKSTAPKRSRLINEDIEKYQLPTIRVFRKLSLALSPAASVRVSFVATAEQLSASQGSASQSSVEQSIAPCRLQQIFISSSESKN